ncbi:GNAT family N-acetyltransferase [Streptomyces fagopyri]|uniref:GNAT family N-acetyltransferase n=1 Tax=Streptomyces fagopyri TaxID=2662397 RepID=UPI0036738A58
MSNRPKHPPVRPATPADIPQAVETLTQAFAHYTWTQHTVSATNFLERLRATNDLFVRRIGLEQGRVWVTDDASAVAVWTTPHAPERTRALFTELGPLFADLAGDRAPQADRARQAMAQHRPTQPVWFLGVVGVHPDAQRGGLGRAVLAPGITAAEQDGYAAYAETSAASNVPFYESLGFATRATVDIPDNGPRSWSLLKKP